MFAPGARSARARFLERALPCEESVDCIGVLDSAEEASRELIQDIQTARGTQKGKRKMWEVYRGRSELTKALQHRGHQARTFGACNGWDFR
eukprot:3976935-Pyramimonas_sp.AAC.1